MNREGTEFKVLTNEKGLPMMGRLSPDGTWIRRHLDGHVAVRGSLFGLAQRVVAVGTKCVGQSTGNLWRAARSEPVALAARCSRFLGAATVGHIGQTKGPAPMPAACAVTAKGQLEFSDSRRRA